MFRHIFVPVQCLTVFSCSTGDQYALKMRLIDHVYDDQVIDQMTVKLILPEGARYQTHAFLT